ncbi:ribose 5-phosphate isomerase B [Acetanaerobacterium elongatum]|uniref:Ribose 5-phosphate isomerase B n=1 Tax=Acetanaerobacterium elongatum TaxID=258515 RepID=A0A1G9YWD6_9FIRM|nr:ribose 5-phosphate isomerase B [Acetanaerobacterium elongatum]SDN13480.1 ribose 5-phosphate isomerase B [Acetanaerobacterium elongatum]
MKNIGIACDHTAVELKEQLMEYIQTLGYDIKDYGMEKDYPIAGYRVANAVASGECALGIVLCGTGCGISLAANKVKGIRAVNCSEPYTAKYARLHNDANVLAMGARVVGSELAKMIAEEFLKAEFEGGRHERRVNIIKDIENGKFPE